jgi:hypothetical protein
MNEQTKKLILEFNKSIVRLKNQRNIWLISSSVFAVGAILIILFSESIANFHSPNFWWAISSVSLIVSVNWWYWTISLIRDVLDHQTNVIKILSEITTDVREIKTDINVLHQKSLIK